METPSPFKLAYDEANIRETPVNFSRCSYTSRKEGKQCGLISIDNTGFCYQCKPKNYKCDNSPLLFESIIAKNVIMIYKCLSDLNYTNTQIHTVLKSSIKPKTNLSIVEIFLFHRKYSPESFGYEIMFGKEFPILSQSVLSRFFHVRFLITTLLSQLSYEFLDLISEILNSRYQPIPPVKSTILILFPNFFVCDFSYEDLLNVIDTPEGTCYSEIRRSFRYHMRYMNGNTCVFEKRTVNNELLELTEFDQSLIRSYGIDCI